VPGAAPAGAVRLSGSPNDATGLRRQRRGNGVGCPEAGREGEKCAGEPVVGVDSGAVRPLIGDWRVAATADRRCRHRRGGTAGDRNGGLY
jgi:hypothetical protein